MKNSQVAVLCAAMLAGSLIVAGTNVWLVRSLVSTAPASTPARIGGTRRGAEGAAGDRDDAEGQGRPLLRQLPGRARRKRRRSLASS